MATQLEGKIVLAGGNEINNAGLLNEKDREFALQACDGVPLGHLGAIHWEAERQATYSTQAQNRVEMQKKTNFKVSRKRSKQVREAVSSGTPVWRASLSKADWEEFGRFIKKHIGNTIPAGIEGAAVVPYLDANPKATQIGKVGAGGGGGMALADLVDFFNGSQELKTRLSAMDGAEDPDRKRALALAKKALEMGLDHDDSTEQDDEPAGEKYRRGEETLAHMGDTLGVTAAGAKKVGDRGEEYVRKLFNKVGAPSPSRARDDQEEALFGKSGLINRAVAQAAVDYANIILDATPEGETWEDGVSERTVARVFRALAANNAEPATAEQGRSEDEIAREVEKVVTLIALGIEGDVDDIADEVTEDWESDNNVLSSFQNLVAKTFRKMFDAEEIAAGTKNPKGRPTKDMLAARAAAAALNPPPPPPPPGKRGRKPKAR